MYRKVPNIAINTGMIFTIFLFGSGMFAAFYSDWIIAAISGNYTGVPDMSNIGFFVAYYIAKRLPLFSF